MISGILLKDLILKAILLWDDLIGRCIYKLTLEIHWIKL